MANPAHVAKLREGVEAWNTWRAQNPDIQPDFSEANLGGADLTRANLGRVNLRGTDLRGVELGEANLGGAYLGGAYLVEAKLVGANLIEANLVEAKLVGANLVRAKLVRAYLYGAYLAEANLYGANFDGADLRWANLVGADFGKAKLVGANLSRVDLSGADLARAELYDTIFADIDLTDVKGLESCVHQGPSIIDHRTLERSGKLPLSFLRGCGLPDTFIDYLPSLLNQPIQHYSCFISYSSKDEALAQRLHADLQDKGVRCWFAPEDLKIGNKLRVRIDEAIRIYEKLLLLLSEHSMTSTWVENEVETAFDKENERSGEPVLFPIRLDTAVMESKTGWAAAIRRTRHIGDFSNWKDHNEYQKGLERLLRDLEIEKGE